MSVLAPRGLGQWSPRCCGSWCLHVEVVCFLCCVSQRHVPTITPAGQTDSPLLGIFQLCIPLLETGRRDSFALEEVMFFSCAKPTSFSQIFEREEIQMHVGDQKVTLVKTHHQFFFVAVT